MTGFPSPQPTQQGSLSGNFASYNATVGTAAGQISPQLFAPRFLRIANVSASTGPNLWISRSLGAAVAPHAPGAILLVPGAMEEFRIPACIPTNPHWAIADAAGCAVTVEVG